MNAGSVSVLARLFGNLPRKFLLKIDTRSGAYFKESMYAKPEARQGKNLKFTSLVLV